MSHRFVNIVHAIVVGLSLTASHQALAAEPVGTPPGGAPTALRVVGGLAGTRQFTLHEEPFWSKELPQLSGGKFHAEIVPFDRAGIHGTDMLRLMQLGVLTIGTLPLNYVTARYPEFNAPDLAGLNPDMAALKKTIAVYRGYLEQTLRERYGIEVLAIYTYPAQALFCKMPLSRLDDLAGRRVRVASVTSADFIDALGGTPVMTSFADLVPRMTTENIDCAITGTMSGNTIGLHEVTQYIHTTAIAWSISVFAANSAAWQAFPAELKQILRDQLPKLETAIWEGAERETSEGVACNIGAATCLHGKKGRMKAIPASAEDLRRTHEILLTQVMPRWLKRCGAPCERAWERTIGPATGIRLPDR